MSRLFREMQAVEEGSPHRSATATVLADLRTSLRSTEVPVDIDTAPAPFVNWPMVDLSPMQRPVLQIGDQDPSTHAASESYRALRTKITRFQAAQGLRTIAISSAVAGEGKTVSALNSAVAMAQLETQRVLLIDGDLRTLGLSNLMGISQKVGLSEVLSDRAEFGDVIWATGIPRLHAVAGGDLQSVASDLFATVRLKEFLAYCSRSFDTVIVDCPPILGLADFDLISAACDGTLIVVRARKTKRESLTEASQHVPGKKFLGIILNGEEQRRTNYYGYYYYSRGKNHK